MSLVRELTIEKGSRRPRRASCRRRATARGVRYPGRAALKLAGARVPLPLLDQPSACVIYFLGVLVCRRPIRVMARPCRLTSRAVANVVIARSDPYNRMIRIVSYFN